jgi:signal transduction histidine kinase
MDISEHKLNEKLQNERTLLAEQRRREAEEAKQQQELLIDITSHEIRNPISSLMQCSSLVKTNLLGLQEDLGAVIASGDAYHPTPQLLHTIQEDLDALDSIYECALTQERISNDVLSLGKIQLDLLQMFDVATDISAEAHKILNVFQNEARMNRVQMSLTFSNAFDELGVANVKLDPVRFGQV